jgi:hypothetical protein
MPVTDHCTGINFRFGLRSHTLSKERHDTKKQERETGDGFHKFSSTLDGYAESKLWDCSIDLLIVLIDTLDRVAK